MNLYFKQAILFFSLVGVLFFNSCSKIDYSGKVKEGIIEYDIEYLNSTEVSVSNLLPKRMVIKFKNNNTINKIESFSGIVSFTHLSNYKKKKHVTLVKLLNKKFQYHEENTLSSLNFESLPGMKLIPTDEYTKIAGYNCRKVRATFEDSTDASFDIYYTNEIKIANPNRNTPYKEIEGVLLQFDVKMYNFNVRFKANSIQKCKVSDSEFAVPVDYKMVNKDTMEEIINLFQ